MPESVCVNTQKYSHTKLQILLEKAYSTLSMEGVKKIALGSYGQTEATFRKQEVYKAEN